MHTIFPDHTLSASFWFGQLGSWVASNSDTELSLRRLIQAWRMRVYDRRSTLGEGMELKATVYVGYLITAIVIIPGIVIIGYYSFSNDINIILIVMVLIVMTTLFLTRSILFIIHSTSVIMASRVSDDVQTHDCEWSPSSVGRT